MERSVGERCFYLLVCILDLGVVVYIACRAYFIWRVSRQYSTASMYFSAYAPSLSFQRQGYRQRQRHYHNTDTVPRYIKRTGKSMRHQFLYPEPFCYSGNCHVFVLLLHLLFLLRALLLLLLLLLPHPLLLLFLLRPLSPPPPFVPELVVECTGTDGLL